MKDMKSQRIAEILKSGAEDTDIVVKGWVRTKRGNKNVAFIALNDGSCVANIQIVVDLAKFGEEQLKPITTGACIRVDGRPVASLGSGQRVEVQAVTADEVRAMITKYFDFSRMHIAIVGPASVIQKPDSSHGHALSDFGPIVTVPADSLLFR